MKLTFLKVDVQETSEGYVIDIAPGALRFEHQGADVALAEPLQLEMTANENGHQFRNILRSVDFDVFKANSLASTIMTASVFAVVTHQDFEMALYRAMRERRVIPLMRLVDERELFEMEYTAAYAALNQKEDFSWV